MKALVLSCALLLVNLVDSFAVNAGTNSQVIINKSAEKKFTDDPINYIIENYEVSKQSWFQQVVADQETTVRFKSSKGYVDAIFDDKGSLIKANFRFKNIALPRQLMAEVYLERKGWIVTKVEKTGTGRLNGEDKSRYRIMLIKDNEVNVLIKHS